MGRKSSFADSDVFAAVAAEIAPGGGFAIKDVSARCGVSVGSLYYRFGSREGLLVATCLDACTAFFEQYLGHLGPRDLNAGRAAAVSVTRFCRDQPGRAIVLLHNSPSGLRALGSGEPALHDILTQVSAFDAAISELATAIGHDSDATRLAVFELPLSVVRFYLPERLVPDTADVYVTKAYDALLGGG